VSGVAGSLWLSEIASSKGGFVCSPELVAISQSISRRRNPKGIVKPPASLGTEAGRFFVVSQDRSA
jgi:hypothetical protein